jgi:hypothetical protein
MTMVYCTFPQPLRTRLIGRSGLDFWLQHLFYTFFFNLQVQSINLISSSNFLSIKLQPCKLKILTMLIKMQQYLHWFDRNQYSLFESMYMYMQKKQSFVYLWKSEGRWMAVGLAGKCGVDFKPRNTSDRSQWERRVVVVGHSDVCLCITVDEKVQRAKHGLD